MPAPSPPSPAPPLTSTPPTPQQASSNFGNEAVTLSDTTLVVSVLNTLDGNTSGTIDANTVTTLTGAAADLNTAYASGGINRPRQ